jgi:hypothetical protein
MQLNGMDTNNDVTVVLNDTLKEFGPWKSIDDTHANGILANCNESLTKEARGNCSWATCPTGNDLCLNGKPEFDLPEIDANGVARQDFNENGVENERFYMKLPAYDGDQDSRTTDGSLEECPECVPFPRRLPVELVEPIVDGAVEDFRPQVK